MWNAGFCPQPRPHASALQYLSFKRERHQARHSPSDREHARHRRGTAGRRQRPAVGQDRTGHGGWAVDGGRNRPVQWCRASCAWVVGGVWSQPAWRSRHPCRMMRLASLTLAVALLPLRDALLVAIPTSQRPEPRAHVVCKAKKKAGGRPQPARRPPRRRRQSPRPRRDASARAGSRCPSRRRRRWPRRRRHRRRRPRPHRAEAAGH